MKTSSIFPSLRNPLLEKACLNYKDDETSLFPYSEYRIYIQGGASRIDTPYIHVDSKNEGFRVRIDIRTGALVGVDEYGTRHEADTFLDLEYKVRKWLEQPSCIPMANGDTNRQFMLNLWESFLD